MTECNSELSYNFYSHRLLVVQFSDLELSSDAGILLARQAEEMVQVCRRLSECIEEWRDPNKITHSLYQLVSQRVYQLVGGYEDANDSNQLRHDPIYKIACGRLPLAQEELLASQPTITRLENHVSKREVAKMRSQMVEGFINLYEQTPQEIVLDIDGWDDPTHGEQQLSFSTATTDSTCTSRCSSMKPAVAIHWCCSCEQATLIQAKGSLQFCAGCFGA